MTTEGPKYEMTLSLNVLKHLGLGLYSNVAAVLSEVVANSWDADAEHVCICIDSQNKRIIIQDDGHGMTVEDANEKYLVVGLERRNLEPKKSGEGEALTPHFKRKVMGRKGIGKLSLFSIARTVEVYSCKDGETHGFKMELERIEDQIKGGRETEYRPQEVVPKKFDLDHGTRIILTDLKRQLQWTERPLRKRLARRFSIIGPQHHFGIELNGQPISIEDRDYLDKIQYIWTFGENGHESRRGAKNVKNCEKRCGEIYVDPELEIDKSIELNIDGWIGTVKHSGNLIDSDTKESINKIVIMVRGKLAQEDILEEFGEGGLYTKYIFGEIHADFLDLDDEEDIATTSRQKLIEDDPRYQALKSKLRLELKHIQNKWTDFRKSEAKEEVFDLLPQIKVWFETLDHDQRKVAERLFGNLNQVPIDDESQRRQLFISGILAFESLKLRKILHKLDDISLENLTVLKDVFIQLDDLEASAYFQIVKERLAVIRKLMEFVDENARERVIQEHLFEHLWLLDPSWERATPSGLMERRFTTAFNDINGSLSEELQNARLDVYFCTTAKKHVVIELKRADRILDSNELRNQLSRYNSAAKTILANTGRRDEPLEIVCVVGRRPRGLDEYPDSEDEFRNSLRAINARLVFYDQLIENAFRAYQEYVDREKEAGRIYDLIESIDKQDVEVFSPTADQS